jgi:hypothetical protein
VKDLLLNVGSGGGAAAAPAAGGAAAATGGAAAEAPAAEEKEEGMFRLLLADKTMSDTHLREGRVRRRHGSWPLRLSFSSYPRLPNLTTSSTAIIARFLGVVRDTEHLDQCTSVEAENGYQLEKDGPGRACTAKTHADFELCSDPQCRYSEIRNEVDQRSTFRLQHSLSGFPDSDARDLDCHCQPLLATTETILLLPCGPVVFDLAVCLLMAGSSCPDPLR